VRRVRVGINGFGRMGRLALRAGWGALEFAQINEVAGDAGTAAHLLSFDSVHGRWGREVDTDGATLSIDGQAISFSAERAPGEVAWDVDLVLSAPESFGRSSR